MQMWVSTVTLLCLTLITTSVTADWKINRPAEAEQTAPLTSDIPAAAAACDRGGEVTHGYIDFGTSDSNHQPYVRTLGLQMERALIEHGLVPPAAEQRRSVEFMFEVDRQGRVVHILVLAEPEEQPLIQFVSSLIAYAQPFPNNEALMDVCFASIVFTAAFDF